MLLISFGVVVVVVVREAGVVLFSLRHPEERPQRIVESSIVETKGG